MVKIDLHTHSNASDGTDSPAELVEKAAAAGLDGIALTDHDTTSGWEEATTAAKKQGLALVYGAEFSTSFSGITTHILGYLFDPKDQRINRLFTQVKEDRVHRLQEITNRVNQVYPITWEQVLAQVNGEAAVGRPHLADALISQGYFVDRNQVFAQVLNTDSPFYVRYQAPEPAVVCETIRSAGGVAVLAHPRAKSRQRRFLSSKDIAQLVDAGLWGIEVNHPEQMPADREEVALIAQELGLVITGSSDYHGQGKNNRLGQYTTPWSTVQSLLEQGRTKWYPGKLSGLTLALPVE